MRVLKPFWAWKFGLGHEVSKNRLSEMCFLLWRGAHFHNIHKKLKKNHAKKHQKTKKFNKITEIAKMKRKSWVQNGSKRQKCPGPTREQHFYWRKRARRRGFEGANASKRWSKQQFLKAFCLESFFKNVLPTEGGEHISAKHWKNNEVKHDCKQKCMLQLAFLMQIRIKVRP